MRQHRAVHPLRAEDVDVVELGELLGGERLRRAVHHVAGVVQHHVEVTVLVDDPAYCGGDGLARLHVEFERAQVDPIRGGVLCHRIDLCGIVPGGAPHRCVDSVTGRGQRLSAEPAESAGRTGDEDDRSVHGAALNSRVGQRN